MKITPNFLNQAPAAGKTVENRERGGQDFAQLLAEQAPAPAGRPAENFSPAALLENQALTGRLLASRSVGETAGAQQTQRQLEKIFDQMDRYAAALGDPGRTLKDIAPLADDLNESAGRLSRLSQGLPENDPLRDLSDGAAVLATVEAMKFKRGDYI